MKGESMSCGTIQQCILSYLPRNTKGGTGGEGKFPESKKYLKEKGESKAKEKEEGTQSDWKDESKLDEVKARENLGPFTNQERARWEKA